MGGVQSSEDSRGWSLEVGWLDPSCESLEVVEHRGKMGGTWR